MTRKMTTDEKLSCGYFIEPIRLTIPDSLEGKVSKKHKTFFYSHKKPMEISFFHMLFLSISVLLTSLLTPVFSIFHSCFAHFPSSVFSYFIHIFSTAIPPSGIYAKHLIPKMGGVLEKYSSKNPSNISLKLPYNTTYTTYNTNILYNISIPYSIAFTTSIHNTFIYKNS